MDSQIQSEILCTPDADIMGESINFSELYG